MKVYLTLDPLQGVIDALGVAAQLPGNLLVRVAFEVQPENAGLQHAQEPREAVLEALDLFGGYYLVERVLYRRAREDVAQRAFFRCPFSPALNRGRESLAAPNLGAAVMIVISLYCLRPVSGNKNPTLL